MTPSSVFVTGTGTGVGKTVVSALLTLAFGADYWKPVQSGHEDGGDRAAVAQMTGFESGRIHPCAYELSQPLSPHEAAKRDGVSLDLHRLCALPATQRPLVVEGAGGVLVPLTETFLMIDLIQRLGLPVVLVAASSLGTINHTLLSLEALRHRDIPVLGVIMNGPLNPANREAVEHFGRVSVLAEIPPLAPLSPETLAHAAKEFIT